MDFIYLLFALQPIALMKSKSIGIFDILRSIGGWRLKIIKIFDLVIGSCLARVVSGKSPVDVLPESSKRILVIRPGGIGDAIFVLPFLRNIKKEKPHLTIDILCEKRNEQVFASQEGVCDGIFCYDQLSSFQKIWRQRYDVIVDTEQWHYLSALVSYFLTSRVNIGFASRPLRGKLFNRTVPYQENIYEIENFKNLFLPVFPNVVEVRDVSNSFFIDDEILRWAQDAVPSDSMALFLGASVILKRLDFSQNTTLVNILSTGRKGQTIILLGGGDVRREAEALCRHFQNSQILNFVSKTTLQQSAALIKRSQLFIGPDSGLMHLANAVGTPVIAVFGPTNHQKWGPRGRGSKIFSLHVECSPCSRYSYTLPTCHKSYKCMKKLDINGISDLLSG